MLVKSLSDKVLLLQKRDVIRFHLYLKLLQFGIRPYENDMEIIIELFEFGGYHNKEEQNRFIDMCLSKKLKKSHQSVRNTLSKYVNLGVFDKPKNRNLRVKEEFIPEISCDKIILQHIISHAD